jgi:hypothetical protein
MTRVIAVTALAALGLPGAPFHEPFHAEALCPVIVLLCVNAAESAARSGGKVVAIPLAPRTARAMDLASASARTGRCSWPSTGGGWTCTAPGGSSARSRAALGSPGRSRRTRSDMRFGWPLAGAGAERGSGHVVGQHHLTAECHRRFPGQPLGVAGVVALREMGEHDQPRPAPRRAGSEPGCACCRHRGAGR